MPRVDAGVPPLHREALVIDALGPFAGPRVYNPALLHRIDELVAAGRPYREIGAEVDELFDAELRSGHIDAYWEGWQQSGVTVNSVTVHGHGTGLFSYDAAIDGLSRWQDRFDRFPDRLVKVLTAADAERAHREGKHGIILGFQNSTHFGDDLALLDQFHRFGVRIVQLTYNSRNLLADGCTERDPSGLSHFGVEAVRRMNDLGILIDVSHTSEPSSLDAVQASRAPIAITHSFAAAVHPHDRGKSDAVIRAVGRAGFVGVVLVPFFLTADPRPTLEHFVRHVAHIAALIGVEHVGIGTDWAGPYLPALAEKVNAEMAGRGFRAEHRMDHAMTVEGYGSWMDWPNLTGALLDAGFDAGEVRGLIGENFLRIFRDVVG